jgi:preprotein translocase subunit SecE
MARLLKKKPASEKIKKSSPDDPGSYLAVKNGAAAKRAPVSGGVADGSRRSAVPTRRASGSKLKNKYIEQALQFLREVRVELKKVTWPSRKQTIGSTVVVIVLVMILSFFLGAVDIGLSSLVGVILH